MPKCNWWELDKKEKVSGWAFLQEKGLKAYCTSCFLVQRNNPSSFYLKRVWLINAFLRWNLNKN